MEVMRRYSREFRAAYLHPQGTAMALQRFAETKDNSTSFQAPVELDHDAGLAIVSGILAADRMLEERKLTEGSKTDRFLIDLLADYRDSYASEPRDMVFGLLGLAKDAGEFYDLVDYSLPLETFLTRLARRLIDLGHDVKVLLQASNTAHTKDLPSWVPNWTSSVVTPQVTGGGHQDLPINKKDFCAGGGGSESANEAIQDTKSPQRTILRVRGRILDTIKHCSLAAQTEELTPWMLETHASPPPSVSRDGSLSVTFLFAYQGLRFAVQHLIKGQDPAPRWFLEACCQAKRDFWEDQSLHSSRLGFVQFISMYMQDDFMLEQLRGGFTPQDETK